MAWMAPPEDQDRGRSFRLRFPMGSHHTQGSFLAGTAGFSQELKGEPGPSYLAYSLLLLPGQSLNSGDRCRHGCPGRVVKNVVRPRPTISGPFLRHPHPALQTQHSRQGIGRRSSLAAFPCATSTLDSFSRPILISAAIPAREGTLSFLSHCICVSTGLRTTTKRHSDSAPYICRCHTPTTHPTPPSSSHLQIHTALFSILPGRHGACLEPTRSTRNPATIIYISLPSPCL